MSLRDVFVSEAKRIFSDVAIVLTIIGGVLLYSFLYPQPYAKESVSSLRVSVVDLDKSDLSRSIIFSLNATPQVDVVREDLSKRDALDALERTLVRAVVIIPAHFKRDLALGVSPTIAVGADSSYFLIFGSVLEGAMKAVLTEGTKVKVANLLKRQVPLSGAKEAYTPYSSTFINLFNPNNSYTQYVIPAVFILILQQTLLIGLGILGGGVNEQMRKGELGIYREASTLQIIFARVMIFGSIFFVHMLFYFGFSYENFHITHIANIEELLFLGVLFLLATLLFGIFLGALFNAREIATPVILFSSLPIIFSVGFIWPLEMIPSWIITLSEMLPVVPAIHGFLEMNQMGAHFVDIREYALILVAQIVVYGFLGYYYINRNRKKYE